MLLYISLVLFYFFCMLLEQVLERKFNRAIWTLILVLPLFTLTAFRAPTVGNDTFNYLRTYSIVSKESFFGASQSRMEIGYIYYMRIIGLFGFDYLGFQIITSAITFLSISRLIAKYSPNIAFSFYIFITTQMFFGVMNTSRQYLAIAILLFSLEYIRRKKLLKFSILVLIATSIHFTSILFWLVYPLSKIRMNRKKTVLLIVMGIIGSIFFDLLVNIFVTLTGKYEGYLEGGYFNFEGNIAIYINLLINMLFFLVAFILKYWNLNYDINREKQCSSVFVTSNSVKEITNEGMWYVFCLLTLIISIMGLNATILNRIEIYFSIFFVVYIPSVVKWIRPKELRFMVALGIIIGLFASFLVIMIYRPYWTTVFPYHMYYNWQY